MFVDRHHADELRIRSLLFCQGKSHKECFSGNYTPDINKKEPALLGHRMTGNTEHQSSRTHGTITSTNQDLRSMEYYDHNGFRSQPT